MEYCKFRKELDWNTLKAYRIDLKQFFEYVREDTPEKATVEAYITELHKKYKPKTIKRKIASVRTDYSYLEERLCQDFFAKVKFCRLVAGSQPAMISDARSSSALKR